MLRLRGARIPTALLPVRRAACAIPSGHCCWFPCRRGWLLLAQNWVERAAWPSAACGAHPNPSISPPSTQARVPVPWLHTARAAARGLWAVCHRGGAAAAPALDPAVLLATLAALGLALPARAAGKNRHARERAARANLQASQALMQSLGRGR